MEEKQTYIVTKEYDRMRVDKYLSEVVEGYSREKIRDIINRGDVCINASIIKPSTKVTEHDIVHIIIPEETVLDVIAQNIPLDIRYEDSDLIIVNKPQGMVVHPAPGNYSDTMVNALLYHAEHLSAINGVIRPGIVHRIDKDTSGLLVVAKNDFTHQALAKQFHDHTIERAYIAFVHGVFHHAKGLIDAPIGRNPYDRKTMAVTEKNNKRAVTHYQLIDNYNDIALLDLHLETGRTHQIRVHMKYIDHPVVGDKLYGYHTEFDDKFQGQLLHAYKLGFIHPRIKKYIEFKSDPPGYFYSIDQLNNKETLTEFLSENH